MPSGELAALWRIWNGEPYPSRSDPKEYEREKKIRSRARKRIVQLREALLMAQAVEALHRFLAERDQRIEERVYERIVKRLGFDAADSFQAYLAGREDEAREAVFREPFEDARAGKARSRSRAEMLDAEDRAARRQAHEDLRRHGLL
jgi:hypothetical protein